nr:hypothetical protein [Deferribacter desulfuricans]
MINNKTVIDDEKMGNNNLVLDFLGLILKIKFTESNKPFMKILENSSTIKKLILP